MAYEVKLNTFEGPLDLLLHLIDKAEVDIYDIPITLITEQYMNYLYIMQEFQLDIASEFLVMAATLLEIKSKLLLPRKEEPAFQPMLDLEEEYDPRMELVERLLEYKKFKSLADELKHREIGRSKIFTRTPEDLTAYMSIVEENPVADVTLYDLMDALSKVFTKSGNSESKPMSRVHRDEVSVKDRMREVRDLLSMKGTIPFSKLFAESPIKAEIVTTFMAILEMMRKHEIVCEQNALFDDILISLSKGGAHRG
ncbi:ScpA family protein [Ammoniphilus sp. CFH 90114]|uniref:segregation and condensation protein A n=1 Tax=Ammoniphilus sp. CFH 90114 TaxID=2493665 RepID=UPI00100F11A7|nr:segregation/condensation protein A [Ammoniphilus sp. CFH 90114]RXT13846.1 segregation/condensation protein A [Ammoniphilus sp. CFH 90114]